MTCDADSFSLTIRQNWSSDYNKVFIGSRPDEDCVFNVSLQCTVESGRRNGQCSVGSSGAIGEDVPGQVAEVFSPEELQAISDFALHFSFSIALVFILSIFFAALPSK